MKEGDKEERSVVRKIADNGMVAALYYALTMLVVLVPVLSQFGPIQCRISEIFVLFAFFRPDLTLGLTIGCFLSNFTGFMMGQTIALDMVFGTAATFVACLLEAYASRFLFIAAVYPVLLNGVIVGLELFYFFNDSGLPIWACLGYVGLGELVALAIGYVLFMVLIRNKGFMRLLHPSRHAEVRF